MGEGNSHRWDLERSWLDGCVEARLAIEAGEFVLGSWAERIRTHAVRQRRRRLGG
jgi:hypothetical protein